MTESFDAPDASGGLASSAEDASLFDATRSGGASETVTRSAAVEDRSSLGQTTVGDSTDSTAKEHAQAVAKDAKDSTKNVASTAASEAKDVANTARTQLRQLVDQLGGEASQQASGQTQRAVQGLRSLGGELSGMAENSQGESGMAADLARQGASRLHNAADWLDGREPGDILEEVRSFARRRPGAFIAGAALLGLVGGRMTRGLTADSGSDTPAVSTSAAPTPRYATGTGYSSDAAYVSGAPGYVPAAGMGADAVDPLDLEGTDPTRVDAGIDPSTYTHPGSSTGLAGDAR
jgi:hypothetical protein